MEKMNDNHSPQNSKLVLLRHRPQNRDDGDENINLTIANHALSAPEDWDCLYLYEQITLWFGRFNDQFFSEALPPAAISINYARRNQLGSYRPLRDGMGLMWRINLNAYYSDAPIAFLLSVLCHETSWEKLIGKVVTIVGLHSGDVILPSMFGTAGLSEEIFVIDEEEAIPSQKYNQNVYSGFRAADFTTKFRKIRKESKTAIS